MKQFPVLIICIVSFYLTNMYGQNNWPNNVEPGTSSGNNITPLNGSGVLGNIYNTSKCGLNYVQASRKVTDRNSTGGTGSGLPCVLNITGIPTCAVIEKAYLWYEESYNISPNVGSPANPNITVTNPASATFNYVGTAIGMAGEKCWGEQGTRAFRIDVTNAISGNGNYSVNTSSLANEIDGMTLMVIYSDYTSTFQGTLVINDGIITTNSGAFLVSQINGFTACGNSTTARAFAIVGDAQYAGGAPNQSHEAILNSSPSTTFNDAFWNFDQLNTSVSAGQTTSNFGITPGQTIIIGVTVDCIAFVAEGLYYQTTTCATCPTPLTLNMSTTTGCGCTSTATVTPSGVPGAYTYSWAPSGGNAATATGLCAGTYTVTVTAANGCVTNTATVNVTNNPIPTPTASNTGPYCAGQNILLNSPTGSSTDDWTGPGGYTSTNTQNPVITNSTTAMSGVYTVTVTNSFGCSATATTSVTVNPTPAATANNTGPYCASATINLSSGGGGTNYDWTGPGGYIQNNTQNPTIVSSTPAMSGVYTVVVTNASGCTSSATTTVTVNSLPTATANNTGPYCAGATIALNSSGGTAYSWTGPLGYTSTSQNPNITSSTTAMSGIYTVVVTGTGGCTSSATTTVTVNSAATASASNTGPYCSGASINLSSGGGGIDYDWTGPGGYAIANTQNPVIANSTPAMSGIYTVTVTMAGGCMGTATTTVTVNASPTATASNTGPYCEGSTISLSSTGGVGYVWSGPSGYSNNIQNPNIPSSTPAMSGIYTVIVTNAAGCTSTATTSVTVNPAVVASASNTGPYCEGATINLSSTGGIDYDWTGPAGYTTPNTQNPSISNSTTSMGGVYTVTVTNASGCSATATITVIVNPTPVATASNTGPYCSGETILLSSSGGTNYSWTGPGGYTNNTQNPSIVSSTPAMSGVYTVVVSNGGACTSSTTTTVTVAGSLTVTAGSNSPVCDGSSLNLISTFVAGGNYVWSGPSGFSSSTQNPVINPANLTNTGTYTVNITNPSGCSGTATVSVTVNTLPVASSGNTGPYCPGSTIQLNSSGGSGYSWIGPNAFSNTTQNPTISGANSAMGGVYTVTVTNAAGCSATGTTNVTIYTSPIANAGNTGPYCPGATVQLNSSGGVGYSWSGPGGYSSIQQNPNIISATTSMTGIYTVIVTDVNGCTSTATTSVTVNPNPVATANNTGPYCEGATINLSSGVGAIDYDWTGPGGYTQNNTQNPSITNATVAMNGVYTVTITVGGGCTATASTNVIVNTNPVVTANNSGPYCTGATIQLNSPQGNSNDDWTGPAGYTSTNTQNPSIINSTSVMTGNYFVTVTDVNGCTGTATTNVTVNPGPPATAGSNSPICETFDIDLTSSGGVNYSWTGPGGFSSGSQNPSIINSTTSNSGIYTVTVTDANGCSATATANVVVNNNLNVTASSNSPVCVGNSLNLSASNIPGANYSWSGPSGFVSGSQNPVIAHCSMTSGGTYTVVATSSAGCTGSATTNANIVPAPTPSFTVDVQSGCAPLCINFTDNSTSSGSTIVGWNWNIEGQSPSNTSTINNCFNNPGLYDVALTVSDANGCNGTISVTDYITVYNDPVASFTYAPDQLLANDPTISFNNSSQNTNSYLWDFGDGTTSNEKDPIHTFPSLDTFCILLTVTSPGGCIDTMSACVHSIPEFNLYIPNAFTPNSDELNNVFMVYGTGIRDIKVLIFDRWGREIFSFFDEEKGWPGTTEDGSQCQIGVYAYRVEVYDEHGRWHEYMGQVNLIR